VIYDARMLRIALVICVVAACSGGGKTKDNGNSIGNTAGSGNAGSASTFSKDTYKCTPPDGVDADQAVADCTKQGCEYTQALICRGAEPPPDVEEAERKSREDGTIACECVCEAQRQACMMVP